MRKQDPYKFDQLMACGVDAVVLGSSLQLPLLKSKRKIPFVVAGVDEAGRGPLAGPVVAAAVILPAFPRLKGLNDSKVMTEVQRELLFPAIKGTALAVSVAVIEPAIIDELNILNATLKAMRHALAALKVRPDLALIDGNQRPGSGVAESLIVKGDSKSASIMAASIIAKVTRDRIMVKIHDQYPEYGFSEHKGYSVPSHLGT
jgi:ribonuclease HII